VNAPALAHHNHLAVTGADGWASAALDAMLARVFAELEPPKPLSIIEWAETYRVLSREETNDYAGAYDLENTR